MESSSEPTNKGVVALTIILMLGVVVGVYAIAREHNTAQNLAAQNLYLSAENHQTSNALDATRQQVSDLSAKVNALAARNEAPAVGPSAGSASGARSSTARRIPRDDPRFKKLQSELDAQGQAIDQARSDLASTQGDLSDARTELTGSIAHTHDELISSGKAGAAQLHRVRPAEIEAVPARGAHRNPGAEG